MSVWLSDGQDFDLLALTRSVKEEQNGSVVHV